MRESLSSFWIFIKHPVSVKLSTNSSKLKKDFLWLLLLGLAFDALVIGLIYILEELALIRKYEGFDLLKEFGKIGGLIAVLILAPVIEECIFRWHLRLKYASIYLAVAGVVIILGEFFDNAIFIVSAFINCFIIAMVIVNKIKAKSQTLRFKLWNRLFPFNFYISTLFFATAHIGNYVGLTVKDLAFILYIMPPLIGGLMLGYVRVTYGLKYSILFHFVHNCNCIAMLILLTFP